MVATYGEWGRKGATLSDKTARKEFGLTQAEIIDAINAGQLDYRVGSVHGNPWLRLLRSEVEGLVRTRQGEGRLENRRCAAELGRVERDIKRIRGELEVLEQQRSELLAALAN